MFAVHYLIAIIAMSLPLAAEAQSEAPDRPVRLVVPFAVGAMGDVVARLLVDGMRESLKRPVIVENVAGAGGNIGTERVVRAPADGSTLLVAATNNLVVNQYLYPSMSYDPLVALQPVAMLVDVPSVVFVPAGIPARSWAEYVEWARTRQGTLTFGSPGTGTTPHLSTTALVRSAGLQMEHVPYKGAGPAIIGLVGGEIQLYLGGAGLGAVHVKAGRLRALAVSGRSRIEALPGTPTFAEAGIADVEASNWWAIAAPKGTPAATIDRLNEAVRAAMQTPAVMARFRALGVQPIHGTPDAMARRLATEAPTWREIVAQTGMKLQ